MQFEVGQVLEGKVTGITKFGAFVELEGGKTGMVHISEVAATFVKEIRDYVKEGDSVKVKILNIGQDGKISLSMKRAVEQQPVEQGARSRGASRGSYAPRQGSFEYRQPQRNEGGDFDDMLSRFMASSDEKISDLRRGSESRRGASRRGTGNK